MSDNLIDTLFYFFRHNKSRLSDYSWMTIFFVTPSHARIFFFFSLQRPAHIFQKLSWKVGTILDNSFPNVVWHEEFPYFVIPPLTFDDSFVRKHPLASSTLWLAKPQNHICRQEYSNLRVCEKKKDFLQSIDFKVET